MLSLSAITPNNSHNLWYTSSYSSHVIKNSTKPKSKLIPGSGPTNEYDEHPLPSETQRGSSSRKLSPLELAEDEHIKEMEAIRLFGFSFMRPPGFTKTEQALMEEQAMSDSEPDDNGFMENPDGETVMVDEQQDDQAALDEEEQSEDGQDVGEDEGEDDDASETFDHDDEEALDGWPRRQRRHRSHISTAAEEVDLDADIPEAEELQMMYDDDYEDGQDELDDNVTSNYNDLALEDEQSYSVEFEVDEEENENGRVQDGSFVRRQFSSHRAIDDDEDDEMVMELDEDSES
ncbi:hypothetical protein V1512DRAFT_266000 [Lipomyces arxii]|uniref:uncharacterized protein n=1 Tax=Lipomyces arxii TaxID=56418 RepID=UPI0034D01650